MVRQIVKTNKTKLTHKDGKPRKKFVKRSLSVNGTDINLRKLSNRKRLVVRK